MRVIAVLAIAACSSRGPAAPVSSGPPPSAPAGKACITVPEDDRDSADSIAIDGDRVDLCVTVTGGVEPIRTPERTCWRASISARTVVSQPLRPQERAPFPRGGATAKVAGKNLELCAPGGKPCQLFPHPGPHTNRPDMPLAVSEDLATIAIGDDSVARLYDRASGKVRATITGWKTEMSYGHPGQIDDLTFVGNRVVVWVHTSPVSATGRVFDFDGKQLGLLGGPDFLLLDGTGGWRVDRSVWAFKSEGHTLVTLDARDGKQVSYDLGSLRDKHEFDQDLLALAATPARIVVVTTGVPPVIGVIDRATKRVEHFAPPACSR